MAKVRLIIPDEDRDRCVDQALREGMTLSAWLRAVSHDRLGQGFRRGVFDSPDTLAAFFHQCDLAAGTGPEPDWRKHLAEIDQAREGVAIGQ